MRPPADGFGAGKRRGMRRKRGVRTFLRAVVALLGSVLVLELPPSVARNRQGARAEALRLPGFSASRAAEEVQWEEKFAQLPSALRAEATLRRLTSEPHMAGTEASRRVA